LAFEQDTPAAHSQDEPAASLRVTPFEGPDESGVWPRLVADAQGGVHMIWTRKQQGQVQLRRSELAQGTWDEPSVLASGQNWFVNWADFPDLVVGPNGRIAAWLQKIGESTFAYGVRLGWQGGEAWLHEDTSPVEHGFVTLTALGAQQSFAVWLDGRDTLDEEGDMDPTASMGLFARSVSMQGVLGPEFCLDDRVCSCCQTDVARLPDGRVLVIWRDRSEGEIRDISWCIGDPQDPASFSEPQSLFDDGWHIPACPVNGPSITATPERVSVAWFSAGGGESRVLVSCAPLAAGARPEFAPPVRLDLGLPVGRVDTCALPDGSLLVTWLEGPEGRARWCARRIPIRGDPSAVEELAQVHGGRGDGFLRLVATSTGALGAYQDAGEHMPALVEITLLTD